MLSVVIPAFNEQEMVPAAAGQIDGILSRAGIPHELIFIDDGSRDATWAEIRAESEHRDTVRGVHFSRNFRKEAAIFAGLQAADGDCVAVIDCDLQHPPEKLVEMYRLWEQGVEVVEGVKTDRGEESLAHRVAAKTFYRLISEARLGLQAARPQGRERTAVHAGKTRVLPRPVVLDRLPHGGGAL